MISVKLPTIFLVYRSASAANFKIGVTPSSADILLYHTPSGNDTNFTIDNDDCIRAVTPIFPTAFRRLRQKLSRLMISKTAKVKVTVFGTSITAGKGCPNQTNRWTNRLEQLMQSNGYTGFAVDNQGAIGGGTSRHRVEQGLTREDVPSADIFIVDYTPTDGVGSYGFTNKSNVQFWTERMIKLLLQLKHAPAVIYLETFPSPCCSCHTLEADLPHYDVLKRLMVPTIFYHKAVCKTTQSDPHWSILHPPPVPTHENIGRLTAGYFQYLMKHFMNSSSDRDGFDHPESATSYDGTVNCALGPVFQYDATGSAEDFPAVTDTWSYTQDKAGRPGWIAPKGHANNISFWINNSKASKVVLTFLATHRKTGVATCWFDNFKNKTMHIDAHDRFSTRSYYKERVVAERLEIGSHWFHCSTNKVKFKIVGLKGCRQHGGQKQVPRMTSVAHSEVGGPPSVADIFQDRTPSGNVSNFTIDDDDCLRAVTPIFPTAFRRLRQKLSRLMISKTAELKVTVLGNSITAGKGCPNQADRWTNRMEQLMQLSGFLGFAVDNQGAFGGSTSRHRVRLGLTRRDAASADIFIIDYTLSDCPHSYGFINKTDVELWTERLISLLLRLKQAPAVVYLETFPAPCCSCSAVEADFPHYDVLKRLMIPTIFYHKAVCKTTTSDPQWHILHTPPVPTHENIGRLTAGYFHTLMKQFANTSDMADFDHPEGAASYDDTVNCALDPVFQYDTTGSATDFPAVTDTWSYTQDVAGRPGWIAPQGRANNISFRINNTHASKVILTYLATYENIGVAVCWFDNHDKKLFRVDALDRFTAKSYYTERVLTERLEIGIHWLHCSTKQAKFKITGITGCRSEYGQPHIRRFMRSMRTAITL